MPKPTSVSPCFREQEYCQHGMCVFLYVFVWKEQIKCFTVLAPKEVYSILWIIVW